MTHALFQPCVIFSEVPISNKSLQANTFANLQNSSELKKQNFRNAFVNVNFAAAGRYQFVLKKIVKTKYL